MQLSSIYIYPIKSTAGIALEQSPVGPRGLSFDRLWVLVDADDKLVTARQYPSLLRLTASLGDDYLEVREANQVHINIALSVPDDSPLVPVQVFDAAGTGVVASQAVNSWFSQFLGIECRLLFMSQRSHRPVTAQAGGGSGDVVSFADSCPLMLLSESTLDALNDRLSEPIPMVQFRPNLVVSGCAADEEDVWQRIRIGGCEFEMLNRVKRCVFATINPHTQRPDAAQEPLRTLAAYRRHEEGGVAFGRHLIARSYGTVSLGDEVEILQ